MYGVEMCSNCPLRKGKYAENEPAFIRPENSQLQRRLTTNFFKFVRHIISVEITDQDQNRIARLLVPEDSLGGSQIKTALKECTEPLAISRLKLCGAVRSLDQKYESNQSEGK